MVYEYGVVEQARSVFAEFLSCYLLTVCCNYRFRNVYLRNVIGRGGDHRELKIKRNLSAFDPRKLWFNSSKLLVYNAQRELCLAHRTPRILFERYYQTFKTTQDNGFSLCSGNFGCAARIFHVSIE